VVCCLFSTHPYLQSWCRRRFPTKTSTFIACKCEIRKMYVDVQILCEYNVLFWCPISAHLMFISSCTILVLFWIPLVCSLNIQSTYIFMSL
jgi:hypothetical protein